MKRAAPVLLAALTLGATANLGLAWKSPIGNIPLGAAPAYATGKEPATKRPEATRSEKSGESRGGKVKETANLIENAEASVFPGSPNDALSREEIDELRNLRDIKKTLDARARKLDERQQSIRDAEARIGKRIDELQAVLDKISASLQMEDSIKNKKIKRLAAVYASMKPDKAAPVIAKMKLPIIVRMLARMDERKVGKILSYLPADKAVRITQALSMKISEVSP